MPKPLNFQDMIAALHDYWAAQGCLIWQPYYQQVGAGTYNPATFLRVLGPEPWRVGYVEPSVRPDDGRFGENPNRLQTHYQYQLILKPDPGNPQELYLGSLEAIGIDTRAHDIRFVEDNWESPALGAWGLGWEVWLDGLEISQYTYFQQAGQIELDPVSVEITYGLDRIAAPLQGVRGFQSIRWNDERTFGDLNLAAEQEHSAYYFDVADVERQRQLYALHKAEAEAALEQGLVLPAYDNLLKLSHTFNVMDTRGAVGVTERQALFKDMRTLARKVATAYVEQRQQMEYPWLDDGQPGGNGAGAQGSAGTAAALTPLEKAADFLLEIGTEELPPADLDGYLAQLSEAVPALLANLHLEHGSVAVTGTPRRLAVHVQALAPGQPDRETLHKGPPADRAYDSLGEPTQAAEGFAKGKGVSVKELTVEEMDGGRYVVARAFEKGRAAGEVLAEALPGLIAGLKVERGIRWNHTNVAFSRPIRWLLALHGGQAIPFAYAGLAAGNETRGLRSIEPAQFAVRNAADYFKKLDKQGIVLDPEQRRAQIWMQVQILAREAGGEAAEDPALLDEVTHLVEAPAALLGRFEEEHLALPREVLVSVMKKHQRYFPVQKDGKLLNAFITVANGNKDPEKVAEGNAAVVRARFADAAFFIQKDLKKLLADYVPDLAGLTFQKDLGSMLDKTRRITALADDLAGPLGLTEAEAAAARRAAELCKADLMTSMVVEMTALQGVMGEQYALKSGESPEVAQAIREHYLPRSTGDANPAAKAGLAVSLADRLDSLAGLFAAGLTPSGSKDPFGLRRAALGLIQALLAAGIDFDVRASLAAAAARLPISASAESQAAALGFVVERQRNLLLEQGRRYDAVDAVLAAQGHNPAGAARAVVELESWVAKPDWNEILPAYARCVRITRDLQEIFVVNPEVFSEEAERELFAALQAAEAMPRAAGSVADFFVAFTPMIPAINTFFDKVLVMAEDETVRANRLGLVQRIAALADGVADFSKLEGF
ncbi:MAG: glycine--tRNA ligase subunit beta [Chloroflexi bacterium]|nr:glycine--tRNA ligase subunit beta [Chloroflexota bacterium]